MTRKKFVSIVDVNGPLIDPTLFRDGYAFVAMQADAGLRTATSEPTKPSKPRAHKNTLCGPRIERNAQFKVGVGAQIAHSNLAKGFLCSSPRA